MLYFIKINALPRGFTDKTFFFKYQMEQYSSWQSAWRLHALTACSDRMQRILGTSKPLVITAGTCLLRSRRH